MSQKMRPRDWSVLHSEASGKRSRESVTIASGSGKLDAGTIVGMVTASKKYTGSPETGADGSETAAAVLGHGVDATSQDVEAVVIKRDAEVKASLLIFHSSVDTDAEKAAKITQLAEVGVITR